MLQTEQIHIRSSELPMFMACPSSLLPADKPVRDTSEAGELGVAGHEALAVMVVGDEADLGAVATKYGCDLEDLGDLFDAGVAAWSKIHQHFDGMTVEGEVSIDIGNVRLTGHPDIHAAEAGLDWKSGRLRYNPRWQLNGYGRMTGFKLGVIVWLRDREFETIEMMKPEDFDAALLAQVEKIGNEYAPGACCNHCERRLECEVRRAELVVTSKLMGAPVDRGEITRDDLARLYPLLRQAEVQVESARDYIREDIRLNGPLPLGDGMELALGIQRRRVVDPQLGWTVLAEALSQDDLADCIKIGITKLEKTIKAAVPAGAARGAKKRAVAEVIDGLKEVEALGYKETEKLGKRAIQDGE